MGKKDVDRRTGDEVQALFRIYADHNMQQQLEKTAWSNKFYGRRVGTAGQAECTLYLSSLGETEEANRKFNIKITEHQ